MLVRSADAGADGAILIIGRSGADGRITSRVGKLVLVWRLKN